MRRKNSFILSGVLTVLCISLISCGESKPERYQHQVEVIAKDHRFEAPDTISSGWVTFHLTNEGREEHFMLVSEIPDSISLRMLTVAAGNLQKLHDQQEAGSLDKESLLQQLDTAMSPMGSLTYRGGVGILSPGKSASATVRLKPGRYLLQCYIRTEEGVRHDHLGMMREMVVAPSSRSTQKPSAYKAIAIMDNGLTYPGELPSGKLTLQVYFNQQPEEDFRGNDVNVYTLKEGYTKIDVEKWIDVFERGGLRSPAPAIFVGGVLEIPARDVAYFTTEFEEGEYHTISEKGIGKPLNTGSITVK